MMATAGEENYLRSSLLLLKGGIFTTQKVVLREEQKEFQKSGQDLDDILTKNKGKLKLEFRNYKQREKLFPVHGKTKISDWDISLLTGVLLVIFQSTLSKKERKAVRSIKLQRNDVYAHTATAELSSDHYSDVCDDLKEALRSLTSEFSEDIKTKCEDIINSCLNGPIDVKSHIEHLKRVSDTDNMFRTILDIIDSNGKQTIDNMKKEHVRLKKDIAEDISNSQEVVCRTVRDTQLTKADFTSLVKDAVQQALQEQRSTRKVKVVNSELEVSGKDADKPNIDLAEQMIKTVTNEAIRRTETSEELRDIREAIQEILNEIGSKTGVKPLDADVACVVIRFSYETYEQLLNLLVYLGSDEIKLHLSKLAALLSHHLQTSDQLHLSASLSFKCLQNILDEIETDSESEYKRTVQIPIQFDSVEGMAHIWNYFESGGATNSLNKVSEALSAKLGTKIKLKSSLNVDQFKSALDEFGSENTARLTDRPPVDGDFTKSSEQDNEEDKFPSAKRSNIFTKYQSEVTSDEIKETVFQVDRNVQVKHTIGKIGKKGPRNISWMDLDKEDSGYAIVESAPYSGPYRKGDRRVSVITNVGEELERISRLNKNLSDGIQKMKEQLEQKRKEFKEEKTQIKQSFKKEIDKAKIFNSKMKSYLSSGDQEFKIKEKIHKEEIEKLKADIESLEVTEIKIREIIKALEATQDNEAYEQQKRVILVSETEIHELKDKIISLEQTVIGIDKLLAKTGEENFNMKKGLQEMTGEVTGLRMGQDAMKEELKTGQEETKETIGELSKQLGKTEQTNESMANEMREIKNILLAKTETQSSEQSSRMERRMDYFPPIGPKLWK